MIDDKIYEDLSAKYGILLKHVIKNFTEEQTLEVDAEIGGYFRLKNILRE